MVLGRCRMVGCLDPYRDNDRRHDHEANTDEATQSLRTTIEKIPAAIAEAAAVTASAAGGVKHQS